MTHLFLCRFDPDHPYFLGEFINKSRDSSISLASAFAFFNQPRGFEHTAKNQRIQRILEEWIHDEMMENQKKNMYGNGELVGG